MALRDRERLVDDSNSVADFVIYHILSQREIGNFLKSALYKSAIERFSKRLPASEIRALVDATIRQELALREQAARARRAEAIRKAQASAGRSSVISSANSPTP